LQNKAFVSSVSLRCKTGKVVAKLFSKQEKLLRNSKIRSKTGCEIEQYDAKLVAKQQKRCEIGSKTAKAMQNVMQNSEM